VDWNVGGTPSISYAQLAVLMDIRDELQRLNRLFYCSNFMQIPAKIDAIRKNTSKPNRKKKKL